MKSIVELINEALSSEKLKCTIENKKNFKALMEYLKWDEDFALDNIFIDGKNIDKNQFDKMMKSKENILLNVKY